MDIKTLRITYNQQFHKLDKFFHKLLGKNPYTRPFLENHKEILLSDLFVEMIKIHTNKKYDNYPPEKLIFKKARKVYIDYVRSLQRESERQKKVKVDKPPEDYETGSFRNGVEAKDAVALIRKFLSHDDFILLYYRAAKGYSYRQILEITSYPSEDAAKTQYHRAKKLVKQHFGEHFFYN